MVQPKPAASSAQAPYSPACTSSFFGTQPTLTHVPPQNRSSATPTRAPWPAAMRAQRTPAEPPPITNRSKSMVCLYLQRLVRKVGLGDLGDNVRALRRHDRSFGGT